MSLDRQSGVYNVSLEFNFFSYHVTRRSYLQSCVVHLSVSMRASFVVAVSCNNYS